MDDLISKLNVILADTYALYLKTQNYHWHVSGPQFKTFHELFEAQYRELAEAVDQTAERIVVRGKQAPATFKALDSLKRIKDGDSNLSADGMVADLAKDHGALLKDLKDAMEIAQKINDEGSANILSNRIEAHEKAQWMLNASREKA